jgi:transcription elongation factor Elf1
MNSRDNCIHRSLELTGEDVRNSTAKLTVVRCANCGTAIGVMINELPVALDTLNQKLDYLIKKG